MKRRVLFWPIAAVFFFIYFNLLSYVISIWIPFNPITDIVSVLIVVFVVAPLSVFSTEKLTKVIREN
jgi:uncharacterized membrane protein